MRNKGFILNGTSDLTLFKEIFLDCKRFSAGGLEIFCGLLDSYSRTFSSQFAFGATKRITPPDNITTGSGFLSDSGVVFK